MSEKGIQKTTKDKYDLISRISKLRHGELVDRVSSHVLSCCDPDCSVCDMGQSGQMIDNEDDEDNKGNLYNRGTRSSEDYVGSDNIDSVGKEAVKASKGDKYNLMRHGQEVARKAARSILSARR